MNEKIITDDEVEIDLLELFFELLLHWKSIALSTILMGAIFYTFSAFFITPTYKSTAELYVLSKSTSITSLTDIQMGSNLTNDYIVVVAGRPVLEQVIVNLGLSEDYEELSDMVTLNNPSNSRILEITVTDESPKRAKTIADEIASVAAAYISEKMDQDPPSVIQYGYADEKPVAPSLVKNAVIGTAVGLLLASVIVILSFMINDTITSAEDVENRLGLNVLGILPLEEESEFDGKGNTNKSNKRARKKGA